MSTNQPVKLTMLMILALLLLSHGVGNIRCATVPENNTDMLALLDFKQAITNDPWGVLSNNWNTTSYCQWEGVKCSLRHPRRVTTLNLRGKGLTGSIAASVGNLTFLHTLDLSNNHFSGQIPHLNNLKKMQFLNLSFNSLGGIIPETLTNCSNLKKIDLYTNFLKGAIPREIGFLTNIVILVLSQNNLTGIIPPTLGNITHLQQFFLQDNQIEGSIPDELGQFSNISLLALGGNSLSGSIPASLFNLSSLQALELRANHLGKTLPTDMGDRLHNLQQLLLGGNMFEGPIPASLGNASMLERVTLQFNNFTGQIPTSFGKLSSLSKLDLEANMLEAKDSESWAFMHALGNCSALQELEISGNQLQGVIPNAIGNLPTSLKYLILGGNKLSGIVPPSIGNLSGLIQLTLDNNSLTGTIDKWIGNMKKLQSLYLSENNFIGAIPPSIGNLTQLTELYLENNSFEGPIPNSLGNPPLLLELDLSYNNLRGNIPVEVSKLKQLVNLRLTSNNLTGEIPDTLGQCQNLVTIQMDKNFLTGDIPTSFGNLKSLTILNLSHNNLSGTIPTALNGLQLLSKLDLSYNHLQGEIPRDGAFRNATAVYLDGNWGLCGGQMDLHMPSCPTVSQRIKMKFSLLRLLIPIFGFMSLIMLIYIIISGKKTSRTTHLLLLSFGKKFPRVSYKDLARATGKFSESNLIGRGSYGSVYRGKITQAKIQVAIKVFDFEMPCAEKSFVSECEVLRSIRHRNLLPILTACSTIDNNGNTFKALIYEFMPNGNLDTWLHKKNAGAASKCLSLAQRINIAVDIADALAYLHHDCERPIVHCDLKPTNILLDDDMNAYLGDFGIASLVLDSRFASIGHSSSNSSVGLKGTIGYMAPEYAQCSHASSCGDVYSYGIVLLEMLIGKRPTDSMFENELTIVEFVQRNFPDQIFHIIDAHLEEECKGFIDQTTMETENELFRCLLSVVQVALSCTRLIPRERMNIREVAIKLHEIRTFYVGPIKQEQVRLP